jgi:hypothetical protein
LTAAIRLSLTRQTLPLLFGGAVLMSISACSLEPGFALSGEQTFECNTEDEHGQLQITFESDQAIVLDHGKQISLHFVESLWPRMEDRYEGQRYSLTLDPEVFLYRPDGSVRGPCH